MIEQDLDFSMSEVEEDWFPDNIAESWSQSIETGDMPFSTDMSTI